MFHGACSLVVVVVETWILALVNYKLCCHLVCQMDLFKIVQITAIVHINLVNVIFTGSNMDPCQIAAVVHSSDLVHLSGLATKSIWWQFGSSICNKDVRGVQH